MPPRAVSLLRVRATSTGLFRLPVDSLSELFDRASDLTELVGYLTDVTCHLRDVGDHRGKSSVVQDGRWGRRTGR